MKRSRFNFDVKGDDCRIVYNSLYNSMVRMSEYEYLQYSKRRKATPDFEKELVEQGLWVSDDTDELATYMVYCDLITKVPDKALSITVTTTMRCNARCKYCYEKGVRYGTMDKDTADNIVDMIRRLNSNGKSVYFTWFGGEPLMNTEIIDYITEKMIEMDVDYSSYIITNGSLITEEIIKSFKEQWNVHNIQISFDGDCDEYEKRKDYTFGSGGFERVVNGVLMSAEAGIGVQIRLNIDSNNLESITQFISHTKNIFSKYDNITYYPAFLSGSGKKLSDRKRVNILKKLLKTMNNPRMMSGNRRLYSMPRTSACMRYEDCSYVIDVNGHVYKCDRCVGRPEYAIGKSEDMSLRMAKEAEIRNKCKSCAFLPKCLGGCAMDYENNFTPCFIDKYLIRATMELLAESDN